MATMADVMIRVMDFFARNRTRIGAFLWAAAGFAVTQPEVQRHPWVVFLLGTLTAGITGAGMFKSDSYQKEVQGEVK